MRRLLAIVLVSLACAQALAGTQGAPRASEDRLLGVWNGTWTGDSAGKFTITVVRDDKAKKLTGSLHARPDNNEPETKTAFKSIVVDGDKATLKYDTAGDSPSEVTVEAALDGKTMKGTWKVVDPATKSVGSSGTFTGSKS
jgi:hypothetical protein